MLHTTPETLDYITVRHPVRLEVRATYCPETETWSAVAAGLRRLGKGVGSCEPTAKNNAVKSWLRKHGVSDASR